MEDVVALMGDASDGEELQPQEELRMDRVLVRRQIIGRTMYPSNAGRGHRYRQGAGHQSGVRRGPQEMRGGGQRNRRERRRAGRQGGNNRGRVSGMPPEYERGGLSRKEWKDSSNGGGYGGQFGSIPYQDVGLLGPGSNYGSAPTRPFGANQNYVGGHPGHFGAAAPHIGGPPGQFGQNPDRGPFGQGPAYGSLEPFGHSAGGSGSCGKGPTYVFNFSNN